jgi:hypothetical protein
MKRITYQRGIGQPLRTLQRDRNVGPNWPRKHSQQAPTKTARFGSVSICIYIFQTTSQLQQGSIHTYIPQDNVGTQQDSVFLGQNESPENRNRDTEESCFFFLSFFNLEWLIRVSKNEGEYERSCRRGKMYAYFFFLFKISTFLLCFYKGKRSIMPLIHQNITAEAI